MPGLFDKLDKKNVKDIKVLCEFVSVFCREKHRELAKNAFPPKDERLRQYLNHKEIIVCEDCEKLLAHGIAKRLLCAMDPKPACRKCPKHCYAPGYREKMRGVMKFSGMYLIRHGRLDLLAHFLQ